MIKDINGLSDNRIKSNFANDSLPSHRHETSYIYRVYRFKLEETHVYSDARRRRVKRRGISRAKFNGNFEDKKKGRQRVFGRRESTLSTRKYGPFKPKCTE